MKCTCDHNPFIKKSNSVILNFLLTSRVSCACSNISVQFSLQLLSTEGLVLNTLSTDFIETIPLLESSSNKTVHSQVCELSRVMETQVKFHSLPLHCGGGGNLKTWKNTNKIICMPTLSEVNENAFLKLFYLGQLIKT